MIHHLFHVAASLDSMVLGETQILGQVRDAYETCKGLSSVGPMLNPLFQRAIAVGKEVMHDTALNEGRLSVASVAVDYSGGFSITSTTRPSCARRWKDGDAGSAELRGAAARPAAGLQSRSGQGRGLATRFGGTQVPFENLSEHLVAADIVITSTGAAHPIITRQQFDGLRKRRRYRPIFLIDIAVPRDIEAVRRRCRRRLSLQPRRPATGGLPDSVPTNRALGSARAIVAQHIESFIAWNRQRKLGPAIHRLYSRYHAIAQDELARTLNKLPNISEAEKAHLEDLARRIVNKLLHDPVQTASPLRRRPRLRRAYLHALEKLFQLGEQKPVVALPDDDDRK